MLNKGNSTLGNYLRSLRQSRTLSLREVERKTGISNAFLSQIESGKVKQPSPVMLYKLAQFYDISYEELMKRAGFPVSPDNNLVKHSSASVFHRFGEITEEEEKELLDYLAFIRSRYKRERHTR